MRLRQQVTAFMGVLLLASLAQGQMPKRLEGVAPCPNLPVTGRKLVDHGHQAVEIVVKMDVDVDGAPNAYGPRGKKTLDILKHARAPKGTTDQGKIVGYMTEYDGGPPTIQGRQDPNPGYYVSQTDFADANNKRMEDPRRYVDATRMNYVVQGTVAEKAGVEMGDFAVVHSCRTGRTKFAIVADSGNLSGAEGSLALVRALGYPLKNGIDDSVERREIIVRYYPKSNPHHQFFKTQADLDVAAKRLGLADK